MIESEHPSRGTCVFVLKPNGSLGRLQVKLVFCGFASLFALIGGGFAAAGAWPVLPFAGLELVVLAYGLNATLRYSSQREVIRVGATVLELECGSAHPGKKTEFPRAWARVDLVPAPIRGHPARLVVCYGARRVEIGRFLVDAEKKQMARLLRRALSESSLLNCEGEDL